MKAHLIACFVLLLLTHFCAPTVSAYTILLDIDTDNDPTTVNESTHASSATVRIILQPTEPNE